MISQCTKFEVSNYTHYEAMNGGAKCRNWGSLGRLGGTQGHGQCHHSIERVYDFLFHFNRKHPIKSNANKRAQVFLFARIFYNITYKLKHLRFQLTRHENCKKTSWSGQCLYGRLLKILSVSASTTQSGKLFHILTTREQKKIFLSYNGLHFSVFYIYFP